MNSYIRIISKQKNLLKKRIEQVKNSEYFKPSDFNNTSPCNEFELNGKIRYVQF